MRKLFSNFSMSNKGQSFKANSLLMVFVLVLSFQARAETFRLFSGGKQVENYNEIMAALTKKRGPLEAPVRLVFAHGPPIVVTEFLGKGGLTAVFKRVDGRALRLPLASGDAYFPNGPNAALRNNGPYTNAMISFYVSMMKLAEAGAPTPKIYPEDSYLPEYITVEYFETRMNLWEFFRRRQEGIEKNIIKAEQVPELKEQLEIFVKKMARFSWIGDFKTEQIVTDGNTWKLIDSSEPIYFITSMEDTTPFEHRLLGPRLGPELNLWFKIVVTEFREMNPHLVKTRNSVPEPALRCELALWTF